MRHYAGFLVQLLVLLSVATSAAAAVPNGTLLWNFTGGAVYGAPAVYNGYVYFGSVYDPKMYALNAVTGVLIWSYTTGGVMLSSTVANGIVYCGSDDFSMYALNAVTGALIWRFVAGWSVGTDAADPQSLLQFRVVSRGAFLTLRWSDAVLWKAWCKKLWKGKQGLAHAVDSIEMQGAHAQRTSVVNTIRFGRSPRISPDLCPLDFRAAPLPTEATPPPGDMYWWELSPEQKAALSPANRRLPSEPWMYALFASIREAKNVSLSKHELVNASWTLRFVRCDRVFSATFDSKGQLTTIAHPARSVRYQVAQMGREVIIDGNSFRVEKQAPSARCMSAFDLLLLETKSADAAVAEDWSWRISNGFLTITSTDIPVPLYLQRLGLLMSPRPP